MNSVLIVIDPQKGFTLDHGTLGKTYGVEELKPIGAVLQKLAAKLPDMARFTRPSLVTSNYRPGQFDPLPGGPLSQLCVSDLSCDCDIDQALAAFPFEHHFIKSEKSALTSDAFRNWISREQKHGTTHFLLCGFLLEHCVLDTALDLKTSLFPANHIIVLSDLVASRASKYFPNGAVEISLEKLRSASIEIGSSDELQKQI